jgi:hypothetical protein
VIRLVRGVRRLTDAPINRSIEHGLHGARSRACFSPCILVRRGRPPRSIAVRAAWTWGVGRCYSLTPASADPIPMHPLPGWLLPRPEPRPSLRRGDALRRPGCGPPSLRRRIATAGGAFTEIVPSSDVHCRPQAPPRRFQADRQLPPHAPLLMRGVPDSPTRPGSSHRPPPKGGAALSVLPREDGGTTQDAFRRVESPASLR